MPTYGNARVEWVNGAVYVHVHDRTGGLGNECEGRGWGEKCA